MGPLVKEPIRDQKEAQGAPHSVPKNKDKLLDQDPNAQAHLTSIGPAVVKEPIRYQKEAKGAPHIVPKNKDKLLGKGKNAQVHEHRNKPKLAIKVIPNAREYEIGAMLNHPVLAKTHELFIKEYPGKRQDKYKLVMEKVDGKKLTSFQTSADAIPKETAVKLIEQAKGCCIYLFQAGVYWEDVNDGNIFIENKTENLRIIDFGYWRKEANLEERGKTSLARCNGIDNLDCREFILRQKEWCKRSRKKEGNCIS